MYSLIGLSIGAVIGLIVAIMKSSKEQHALRQRFGNELDDDFGEDSQFHEDIVLSFEDFEILEKKPNHPLKTKAEAKAELYALEEAEALSRGDSVMEPPDTPLEPFDKTKVVKVYASRKPLKMNTIALMILFGTILWAMYGFFKIGGWEDIEFILMVLFGLLFILSPLIGVILFYGQQQKKAVVSGDPILEFTQEEMRCHSKICGDIQQIKWTDVIHFAPQLPTLGLAISVDILHQSDDGFEIRFSKYSVNAIDLELVEFIELLERYTGLVAVRV